MLPLMVKLPNLFFNTASNIADYAQATARILLVIPWVAKCSVWETVSSAPSRLLTTTQTTPAHRIQMAPSMQKDHGPTPCCQNLSVSSQQRFRGNRHCGPLKSASSLPAKSPMSVKQKKHLLKIRKEADAKLMQAAKGQEARFAERSQVATDLSRSRAEQIEANKHAKLRRANNDSQEQLLPCSCRTP